MPEQLRCRNGGWMNNVTKNIIWNAVVLSILLGLSSCTPTKSIQEISGNYVGQELMLTKTLELHENQEFDYSKVGDLYVHPERTKGNWKMRRKKIILETDESNYRFEKKYIFRITEDSLSRKPFSYKKITDKQFFNLERDSDPCSDDILPMALPFQCCKHIYAPYGDYYYLQVLPDGKYEMKIGMYLDQKVTGEYQNQDDTLTLITHNFINDQFSISDTKKRVVQKGLSNYEIIDSLLIPIEYKREIPLSRHMQRDSTIVAHYIQTDGHAICHLLLHHDSTFLYSTGIRWRHTYEGTWVREGDILKMTPFESDNLLHWSCTDNQMIFRETFLIGMRVDEEAQQKEYNYFIELKPRVKTK